MRSTVICTPYQTFKGYQVREDDIVEACSMHGKWCMLKSFVKVQVAYVDRIYLVCL
jgi:hypothetical protein